MAPLSPVYWTLKEDGIRASGTICSVHGQEHAWLLPLEPSLLFAAILVAERPGQILTISLKSIKP